MKTSKLNKAMKTSKLNTLFLESVKRGVNEEVDSMDLFSYRGKDFTVIKTSENTFALYDADYFLPVAEYTTETN